MCLGYVAIVYHSRLVIITLQESYMDLKYRDAILFDSSVARLFLGIVRFGTLCKPSEFCPWLKGDSGGCGLWM